MTRISVEDIQELYFKQQLSMQETADCLGKNITQVYKFMQRHNLARRTSAETNRINFYKSPLSFNKKSILNDTEKRLHEAAMMLYWAEGYKAGLLVDFVNSDPLMIKTFIQCLRKVYRVNENRISIQLYCYNNQHPNTLIEYWSKLMNIPSDQFTKPYIRYDYKIEKTGKMPHGVIHLRYSDRRLYEQIMEDIGKITQALC